MFRCYALLVLTCLYSLGLSAQDSVNEYEFKPFKAEYIAYKWGDALGKASMVLEPMDQQQYSLLYKSHVSKFFLSDKRTEHSIFTLEQGEIKAKQYQYARSGTGKNKNLLVDFDPQNAQIDVTRNRESYTLPWQGEIDNQLYRLQISKFLSNDMNEFEINFINYRGEKKTYTFVVEKRETLALPYRELDTIKVKINRLGSSRETFAWFAPELNYYMVRLQQFKDGKEQGDIKLSSFSLLPSSAEPISP